LNVSNAAHAGRRKRKETTMLRITRQDLIHKTTGELSAMFRIIREQASNANRPGDEFNNLQAALTIISSELDSRTGPTP
jgi:hypothetical protein